MESAKLKSSNSQPPNKSRGLLALTATAGGVWLGYRLWESHAEQRIFSRSRIIETAMGPVEYTFRGDDGPVVVVSHGLPGGFDQGHSVAGWLSAAPCRFLCISRPGYLRTPLSCGRTPDEQADLIAATMDALDIPEAAVLGLSAGGPSAVRFAIRHPRRCWGLVLASCVSVRIPLGVDPDNWLVKAAFPPAGFLMSFSNLLFHLDLRLATGMMTPEENRMIRENHDRDIFLEFTKTYVPLRVRQAGMINDAQQFARLPEAAPSGVQCPTCIVHGDADRIVPFHHALASRDAIPQADLLVLENGSHLAGVARRREVSQHVVAFLAKYANQPATLKP